MELLSFFSSSSASSAAGDVVATSPRGTSMRQESKFQLVTGQTIGSKDKVLSVVDCQVYAVHSVDGRGVEEGSRRVMKHMEILLYLICTALPCSQCLI